MFGQEYLRKKFWRQIFEFSLGEILGKSSGEKIFEFPFSKILGNKVGENLRKNIQTSLSMFGSVFEGNI